MSYQVRRWVTKCSDGYDYAWLIHIIIFYKVSRLTDQRNLCSLGDSRTRDNKGEMF